MARMLTFPMEAMVVSRALMLLRISSSEGIGPSTCIVSASTSALNWATDASSSKSWALNDCSPPDLFSISLVFSRMSPSS